MLRTAIIALCFAAGVSGATPAVAQAEPVARVVLAVWDSQEEQRVRLSRIHTRAEMPLNHLGLVLRYVDIRGELPDAAGDPQVRGVVSWLSSEDTPDPQRYAAWLEAMLAAGKRIAVLGALGVEGPGALQARRDALLARLGVEDTGSFVGITYDVEVVHKDPGMVEFERRLEPPLPVFNETRAQPAAHSHLSVRRGATGQRSDLVITSARGGYAAGEWIHHSGARPTWFKWYLNPFAFFRAAFATEDLPKPDVTTLSGRRIYYSHIDGDGWRNVSRVDGYRQRGTLSSEVVLREIIAPYPDLPVTVAPVTGDLDARWYGTEQTRRVARELFALPQVEAGTHTATHPFYWRFFEHYAAARERRYLPRYRELNQGVRGGGAADAGYGGADSAGDDDEELKGYYVPRSFGKHPFDLDAEIDGSIEFLNALLPAGKRVKLLQWSGDTDPFEAALAKADAAGVRNINGGDSRLDLDYDSHGWVAPVGRQVGRHWQVYASNSNENTYTGLWTQRFFGQRYLIETLERTGTPRRLRPINLYYHMYSGERSASLDALKHLLDYVRGQELAPIAASRYAGIAEGFLRAQLTRLGPRHWRIEQHQELATLRFDDAQALAVDFTRSRGVVGMRHALGNLYVALDEAVAAPEVALREGPAEHAPVYLEHARWRVRDVAHDAARVSFQATGFGPGDMVWRLPPGTRWHALAGDHVLTQHQDGDRLHLRLRTAPGTLARVTLQRETATP
jgi:hypothetical protein